MRSMTGCGRGQLMRDKTEMTLELKCVNHRFLDIACRLPRQLSFLEEPLRRGVSQALHRGHVDVFLAVRTLGGETRAITVNENLAKAYCEAGRQLNALTGCEDDLTMARLMAMDGVLEIADAQLDEEALQAMCSELTATVCAQVSAMREREGAALQSDLALHLNAVSALRGRIVERAPMVVAEYRRKLQERLSQLPIAPVDPARLAQEVALLADRCAIDEELSRLQSHIAQMRAYLNAPGEIGKKMDFLIQELNRETNTIGSKANDAAIAQLVVDLKSEVEKLREQIQNVE